MQSVSSPLSGAPQKRAVSFSPTVDSREEERALKKDKKKVTTLLLESDVAFVVDLRHAKNLLEQAKAIIDNRFSDDEALMSKYLLKMRILNRE